MKIVQHICSSNAHMGMFFFFDNKHSTKYTAISCNEGTAHVQDTLKQVKKQMGNTSNCTSHLSRGVHDFTWGRMSGGGWVLIEVRMVVVDTILK
jgi:hypothetical protein